MVFITADIIAQEPAALSGSTEPGRLYTGVSFSPDICYRQLVAGSKSSTNANILTERNSREIHKPGFTTGFNLLYRLTQNLAIETGVHYAHKGFSTRPVELFPFVPSPAIPDRVRSNYSFHYMEVPVKGIFVLNTERVRYFAGPGINPGFLLAATEKYYYEFPDRVEKHTQHAPHNYRFFSLSATFSLGADILIGNRSNVRFEPIIRYGVLDILDAPLTAHLYSAGFNMGYYLRW